MPYKLTVAAICLCLLASCETMDQSECSYANWQEIGEQDASDGRAKDYFLNHDRACRNYGISLDKTAYDAGWQVGIKRFCTKINGWDFGLSGGDYQNSCPASLEDRFYSAFQLGRTVHQKKSAKENLQYQLDSTLEDLSKDDLSAEKRAELKKDKKRLKRELLFAGFSLTEAKEEARNMGFSIY